MLQGESQELKSGRDKPRFIRNCKKDINLVFPLPQIKESLLSLQIIYFEYKIRPSFRNEITEWLCDSI